MLAPSPRVVRMANQADGAFRTDTDPADSLRRQAVLPIQEHMSAASTARRKIVPDLQQNCKTSHTICESAVRKISVKLACE